MTQPPPSFLTEIPSVASLRAFFFPGGEDRARLIRAVRMSQKGEMRMSPDSRWIPFTAKEFIDATRSHFRWEARLDPGKVAAPTVVDAYEEGRGRLTVKLGGLLPVKKFTGPDVDQGELQRYLASIVFCPPMLLNHAALECNEVGAHTLQLRDGSDTTAASVSLDLAEEGMPFVVRAIRPRLAGKQSVLTPWSGIATEFQEFEGLRVPNHLEVAWHLPEGPFTYFREEVRSFEALR